MTALPQHSSKNLTALPERLETIKAQIENTRQESIDTHLQDKKWESA